MPYIEMGRRQELYPLISKVAGEIQAAVESGTGKRDGEYNFVITILGEMLYDRNYTDQNARHGVLACAQMEAYRRVLAGYEDDKCATEGDVF